MSRVEIRTPRFVRYCASSAVAALLFAAPASAGDNADLLRAQKALRERGITFSQIYTNEVLGNVSGGVKRGAIYAGKLEANVTADLDKLLGWSGWTFYSNAFQIHRTAGMRDNHFLSTITVSNIEATPSTRLSELWLERKFFGDRFSIRFGQLAADTEFFISEYSQSLIQSDWPTILGGNLPSGGPAYPLSTPGVRLKFSPSPEWTALFAIFNGDPGEQDGLNRTGTRFPVKDPPLLISELQHRQNQEPDSKQLARTLRLGGWHHLGDFNDLRFDTAGLSLADPVSSGIARRYRGTSGIYGIVDQQLYRPAGGGPNSGIAFFSRIAFNSPDKNPVSFFLDGGLIFTGLFKGRPDDKLSTGFIFAKMSNRLRELDRDTIAFTGMNQPLRDYEMTLEINYQIQVRQGWTVQPLAQYVIHPGGHVPDPAAPSRALKGGALFGARSTLTF